MARQAEASWEFARRIDDGILVLFSLVTESVGWATAALLEEDVERADRVIADDHGVDERCAELSGLVKERLEEAAADPEELERLVEVLVIIPELERSADLAEHIARRSRRGLGGIISPRSRGLIQSMGDVTVRMWLAVGLAYRQHSLDASFELKEADQELDGLAASLVSESVAPGADPQVAVDLALVARFYERLGDHAVNLARRVEAMAAPKRLALPKVTTLRSSAARVPAKAGRVRHVLARLGRFRLAPTDEGFLDLFQAAATNVRDCADELSKLAVSYIQDNEHFDKVKSLERRGDQYTRDILLRLDASFVIPFDREDIHKLAEELDDVVNDMMAAAALIQAAQVDQPIREIGELAELAVGMAEQLVALMDCLGSSSGGSARHRLEQIEHLERQGDAIFHRGMGRLFSGDYDTLDVIKEKDILQATEQSLNAMEDVSDVVESILVKRS